MSDTPTIMTAEQLHEALLDTLAAYERARPDLELASRIYAELDAKAGAIKADLYEEISDEMKGGKPIFSSDIKRWTEINKRLTERHSDLIEQFEQAEVYRGECQTECDSTIEALKTYRALARLLAAQMELEVVRQASENILSYSVDITDEFNPLDDELRAMRATAASEVHE